MKICPNCQSTYTDESLNFCLDDGATLVRAADTASSRDSEATFIMSERTESLNVTPPTVAFVPPTQVYIPRGTPTDHTPPISPTAHMQERYTAPDAYLAAQQPKPRSNLLIASVTAIAILLLLLVGIGIALLMRGAGKSSGANNTGNVANGNSSTGAQTNNSESNANANNQNADSTSSNDTHGSLSITASASSTRVPLKAFRYIPANVLDNSFQTAWIEGVPGPGVGEWIRCNFEREVKLNSVLMTPGYFKNTKIWRENNRLAAATVYFSDGSSRRFTFPDQMQQQRLNVGGIRTLFVRIVIEDYYPGSVDSEDTPISQISFDWEP